MEDRVNESSEARVFETPYSRLLSTPTLNGAIQHLETLLSASYPEPSLEPASGQWSNAQILGHLIDSALNNHARFVRAQIPEHLTYAYLIVPGYAQNDWVTIGHYDSRSWDELLILWRALNGQILHVMKNVGLVSLFTPCIIGEGEAQPLEALMIDYVGHTLHHLQSLGFGGNTL